MESFDKNFNFDSPLDTITYHITINDDDDDDCISYRAIFDCGMNRMKDVLSR